jgi:hypothetical protein
MSAPFLLACGGSKSKLKVSSAYICSLSKLQLPWLSITLALTLWHVWQVWNTLSEPVVANKWKTQKTWYPLKLGVVVVSRYV